MWCAGTRQWVPRGVRTVPVDPTEQIPSSDPREGEVVDRVRVASVPAGHVYVRHLSPEDGGGPVRLPDPAPAGGGPGPGARWWPPVMLQPGWVEEHHDEFDLLHLHFGFDAWDPRDLTRLVASLRAHGKPFVYTVHDLRNPHHADRRAHDDQLDVLVPAADALLTLTRGAAGEIRRRWDREAFALPHPHVVPLDVAADWRKQRRRRRGHTFRVGLHLKSLRPSMAPDRVLATLVETVGDLPGAVLQVNVHRDVMEPTGARHHAELARQLRTAAAERRLELHVHDFLDDDGLWTYLAGLDVSVLPYRFGTHSGWLEACRDLGTAVVAPSCGYYAEQGPVVGYTHDEDRYDPATLDAAVRALHAVRGDHGVSTQYRRRQRRAVAAGHDAVYRAVLPPGDGSWGGRQTWAAR